MQLLQILNWLVVIILSSRRRHTICSRDWSSDVCSSDLGFAELRLKRFFERAHQLNAIERREAEAFLKRTRDRRPLAESREQSIPWTRLRFPKAARLTAVHDLRSACGDDRKARFACRSARKIQLGPAQPVPHALIFSKRRIRLFDGPAASRLARIRHQENRQGFGVAVAFKGNDHAIAHAGLPVQGIFQILGVNIQTCGRSEEHTSELQSRLHLVCRLLLEKKKNK